MSAPQRHFRVSSENERYIYPRVLCGRRGQSGWVAWGNTLEMRVSAVVDCPECMVIKDLWLQQPKPKPLTIRRARPFLKSHGIQRSP